MAGATGKIGARATGAELLRLYFLTVRGGRLTIAKRRPLTIELTIGSWDRLAGSVDNQLTLIVDN